MSTTRKVRVKKLNIKTPLPILREDEIDASEYESLTQENSIATGVDQAEENEYHLQAVLQGPGASTDKEIPVPPPQESKFSYDELYPVGDQEPGSYIRFSQTVEDCIGCLYDMTEQDEKFLKSYNSKRLAAAQLGEDDLESIMEVFEDTAAVQTPYAAIDQTIAPYSVMTEGLAHTDTDRTLQHAKEVYEYWKSERQSSGNGPLHAMLKFETHQETDELDPFVCFRRREVRQTRKTRARDVQSADKLRRLRREIEDARQLIDMAINREKTKYELMQTDKEVHNLRGTLKTHKIRLGIKTDDDDLVNQKPQKRKITDLTPINRTNGSAMRAQRANEGVPDLLQLADVLAEKQKALQIDIIAKVENHRQWNKNHIDLTQQPLSPPRGPTHEPSFRPAQAEYLPTPPASASDEDGDAMDLDVMPTSNVFQFQGFEDEHMVPSQFPAYRRRIGRGGRLWIDRRGVPNPSRTSVSWKDDQSKYDQDDSDDEQPIYHVDPHDLRALKFRASIPITTGLDTRRQQLAQQQQQQQQLQQRALAAGMNGGASAGGPSLPHAGGPHGGGLQRPHPAVSATG